MILSFFSCKSQLNDQQQCIKTSAKLLNYFKTKDTTAIANLIGVDLKTAGKSMSFIYDECIKVSESLMQYGNPKIESFEYVKLTDNSFVNSVVTILIKDTLTNSIKTKIEVYFAPENIIPHTKINTYSVEPIFENLNLSPPSNNQ